MGKAWAVDAIALNLLTDQNPLTVPWHGFWRDLDFKSVVI